jgi:hypothetical protein
VSSTADEVMVFSRFFGRAMKLQNGQLWLVPGDQVDGTTFACVQDAEDAIADTMQACAARPGNSFAEREAYSFDNPRVLKRKMQGTKT